MTKEEFLALDEKQKQEILDWAQETKKVEPQEETKTLKADSDSQKNGEDETKEESEETKVETKSKEEQADKNDGEQEDEDKTEKKTDEKKETKPEYNATADIKKFGGDLEKLMAAQAKTLETLEKLAETNANLKKELDEVKKRSPMGNYQPKPSDDVIAKEDKERDSFVEKYKNAYKN